MFELIIIMMCTQAGGMLVNACAQVYSIWHFGVCDGSIVGDAGEPMIFGMKITK